MILYSWDSILMCMTNLIAFFQKAHKHANPPNGH